MSRSKSSSSKPPKEVPVELGFLEDEDESSRHKLRSAFFPSKFGGLPAWLDLKGVPNLAELKCPKCSHPMKFLLQVYAPMDSPEAFHRTIFLFVCARKECCVERNSNKNVAVLRSQLGQENECYGAEAPDEKDVSLGSLGPSKFGVKGCKVCGLKSTQSCSKCEVVYYCGKEHQTLDWGAHKGICSEEKEKKDLISAEPMDTYCYKEMALVIDTEVIPKEKGKKQKDKSEKERLEEYEKLVAEGKAGTLADDSAQTKEMLEDAALKADKAFEKFKKRVAYHPDQVLRYDREGVPLWVSGEKAMEPSQVPDCEYCKGKRVFEFQVMPQLLNHVGDDSIIGDLDWGTLAVYTCQKSCSEGPSYKREFVWKQDFKGDEDADKD